MTSNPCPQSGHITGTQSSRFAVRCDPCPIYPIRPSPAQIRQSSEVLARLNKCVTRAQGPYADGGAAVPPDKLALRKRGSIKHCKTRIPSYRHWRQLKRISMYFKVVTGGARATRRHPREGGGPGSFRKTWIPAFAGMTFQRLISSVSAYQHRTIP